ncbi:hypothetical protein BH09MYX1_BH09MYX1_12350 [soil metagenome]
MWEYHLLKFEAAKGFFSEGGNIDDEKATSALNALGSEGWELCGTFETSVVQGRTAHVTFILKRKQP